MEVHKSDKESGVENWIVMMKSSVGNKQLVAACSAVPQCKGHGAAGGVPFFEITATKAQLKMVLKKYRRLVKMAEPGLPMSATPMLEAQQTDVPWGLKRIRSRELASQPSSDPGPANGAEGVNVYVLDTGVRVTHTEFGGRAIPGAQVGGFLGLFVEECNGDKSCAADKQSHGTHCAGTIGGESYGVAKGATIHAVKVLGDDGSGSTFGIVAAMNWVGKNALKPAVASMSLGGGKSDVLNDAVGSMVDAGVVVVTASGNENTDGCTKSPGGAPASINVGATDSSDVRAVFSNYGTCLDIFAPGVDVLSSIHTSDTSANAYSGTSMACPHVSGAAAMLLATNGDLTPLEVKLALVDAATPDVVSDDNGSPNLLLYSPVGGGASARRGGKKSKGGKGSALAEKAAKGGKGGKKSRANAKADC